MSTVIPRHVTTVENGGTKGELGYGKHGGGYRMFTKGAAEIVLQKFVFLFKYLRQNWRNVVFIPQKLDEYFVLFLIFISLIYFISDLFFYF